MSSPTAALHANYAVYQALCNVGDTVMGMNLDNGGHLTHGSPVNYSGINYNIVPYGVDPKTHRIDYDKVREHRQGVQAQDDHRRCFCLSSYH